jgi:DnaJ-class molecular chaperone
LINPERRAHYDKYGTVMDDMESEEAYFKEFESMFMGGGNGFDFFSDFDAYTEVLESDSKMFRNFFRDLGSNYRMRGTRR